MQILTTGKVTHWIKPDSQTSPGAGVDGLSFPIHPLQVLNVGGKWLNPSTHAFQKKRNWEFCKSVEVEKANIFFSMSWWCHMCGGPAKTKLFLRLGILVAPSCFSLGQRLVASELSISESWFFLPCPVSGTSGAFSFYGLDVSFDYWWSLSLQPPFLLDGAKCFFHV